MRRHHGDVQGWGDPGGRSASAFPGTDTGVRQRFVDGGVTGAAATAPAWAYDASGVVDAATAERPATALGVSGAATPGDHEWVVGSTDGTGPRFALRADGWASFGFDDPTSQPGACTYYVPEDPVVSTWSFPDQQVTDVVTAADGAVSSATRRDDQVSIVTSQAQRCTPQGGVGLSPDEAARRATAVIVALGADPADFRFGTPGTGGGTAAAAGSLTVDVSATHLHDGVDTAQVWTFRFLADRLAGMSGAAATFVDLGTVPTISAAAAVQRLNDPASGPVVRAGIPMPADSSGSRFASGTEPVAPAPPTLDDRIRWPVDTVAITAATITTVQQVSSDGGVLLVPSWTLIDDDDRSWSVIAVAEEALDLEP
ncbi:hypothetical protein [Nakamurella deserti]|uniref:hypothetical protein n=1 Tax=Nakamurella deserti TaxID=2164074 RepID=UPI001478FE3F|nr:hypothetical protein [Nakamurella deserti]